MFFYHGERDHLVPALSPQVMVARLTTAGVTATLLTIPGAGHIAAFFDPRGSDAAVEFLDRHLRKQAPAQKSP
jgi:pimeloyl-ACP methyl ester carboxylesterase